MHTIICTCITYTRARRRLQSPIALRDTLCPHPRTPHVAFDVVRDFLPRVAPAPGPVNSDGPGWARFYFHTRADCGLSYLCTRIILMVRIVRLRARLRANFTRFRTASSWTTALCTTSARSKRFYFTFRSRNNMLSSPRLEIVLLPSAIRLN